MPRYKFVPDKDTAQFFATSFEVYDEITNTKSSQKVIYNQEFTTDIYYPKSFMEKESLEFISDEPYISPIICSKFSNCNETIELPEYRGPVNIYVAVNDKGAITLGFNNDNSKLIMINSYSSGFIFKNILLEKIRVINTAIKNPKTEYSIAVIISQ